jgi:hypothetical protein
MRRVCVSMISIPPPKAAAELFVTIAFLMVTVD